MSSDKEQQYKKISGLILNHPNKDGSGTNRRDAIEPLSEIENITELLKKYYKKIDFKTIVDNRFKNVNELITLVEDKEAETRLKELEEGQVADAKEQVADAKEEVADVKSQEVISTAQAISELDSNEITIEMDSSFEAKLKEMEAKLPPKLVDNENKGGFLSYKDISDKEFCYKFLYCYLNNKDNQTNEIKAICKDIFNVYKIENGNPMEDFSSYTNDNIISNITFDVGFIINVETTKGGASAIPTQKRRPNKPKKRNHTIKDMVRVKTR